jgi:DNA-directed RNA polymerase specialized sigma24 family protein
MTIAALIAPVLPRLRRHARALAGSQASGDAYVGALLEALVADPSIFDKSADPRVEAFRLMTAMWPSLQVHTADESGQQWEKAAARKLGALTPLARQAFLLTAVEDFSAAETAIVLGKAEAEIAGLLDQAAREISEQVRTRVLIIEDEPLIAHDIETLVGDLGHEVTGVARTHAEANRLADETAPGLVLADIQLADGSSGIDAVNDIIKTFNVPVIFITAFPERLLTGEKPEPAFLITKPFIADMVKAIISQALFFDRSAGGSEAAA